MYSGIFFELMRYLRFCFSLIAACALLSSCGNSTTAVTADSTPKTDSLSVINNLLHKDPNNIDLYYRRAMYYVSAKDYASAMMDINRVLNADSTNTKYIMAGADIYFFSNKIQRADQLLRRAVELEPKNIDCLLKLAQLHHYLKRYDDEVELLGQVLDLDKRNAQAYFMRGMVGKETGDTAKAMQNMQLAVQMDPDYYNAYIQMGVIAAAQKSPAAIDYYRNALKIQPASIEALYDLGMYYQDAKQYDLALNTYKSIVMINPMHFDAHFNMGAIYTEDLDSVDKGMENFNLAIRDNPNDPRGYFGRGKCYEKNGQIDLATADYKKALELDPQFTGAAMALDKMSEGAN